MRMPYKPLSFDENSYDLFDFQKRIQMENEAKKNLFAMEELNKHIIEVCKRLKCVRKITLCEEYKNKEILFSLEECGICRYSEQRHIDENTEQLLLDWLESARVTNEKIKKYFKQVTEQLDNQAKELLHMTQSVSLIDIANKYNMNIEETVKLFEEAKHLACKIAYLDYV